ncbi:hypothetical protein PG988_004933 [Apiospora saccharicola]
MWRSAYVAKGAAAQLLKLAQDAAKAMDIETRGKSRLDLEVEISLANFDMTLTDKPDLTSELLDLWDLDWKSLRRRVQPPPYVPRHSKADILTYFMQSRVPLPAGPLHKVPATPPRLGTPINDGPKQTPASLRESLDFWYIANTLRDTRDFGPSFEGTITLYIGSARSPYTYTVRVLVPPASTDVRIPGSDLSGEYDWIPVPRQAGFPSEGQLRHGVTSGRFASVNEAGDVHKKSLSALKHVMASWNGSSNADLCVLENSIQRDRDTCVRHITPQALAALARHNRPSIFEVSAGDSRSLQIKPSRALWFDFPELEPISYRQKGSDLRPVVIIMDYILQMWCAQQRLPEAWARGRELAQGRLGSLDGAPWPGFAEKEPASSQQDLKGERLVPCPLRTPEGTDIIELVLKRATRERTASDGKNPEMNRQMWTEFAKVFDTKTLRDLFDKCLHGEVVQTCLTIRSIHDIDGLPHADLDDKNTVDALAYGDYPGWYLIMIFDIDDNIECMLYVGQTTGLRYRVLDHMKIADTGSKLDSLLYFVWSRPGKHVRAVYLGHIEVGQFDQLLHLQCFLTLGEEVLSVYLQSLHSSLLGLYLNKTEVYHSARGLQRKYPLEGGSRGAVAAIAWLTSSDNADYNDFARQRLSDRPHWTLVPAIEQGFLRPAQDDEPPEGPMPLGVCEEPYARPPKDGEPKEVLIQCNFCKAVGSLITDDKPTFARLGQPAYIVRQRTCAALCGGAGPASVCYHSPADPDTRCVTKSTAQHEWKQYMKTTTTHRTLHNFVVSPDKTGPPEANVPNVQDGPEAESEASFARYSFWHYLGPNADEFDTEESIEDLCAVGAPTRDDVSQYSFWHYLGPEGDKSS